jgi:hypothetical protein
MADENGWPTAAAHDQLNRVGQLLLEQAHPRPLSEKAASQHRFTRRPWLL